MKRFSSRFPEVVVCWFNYFFLTHFPASTKQVDATTVLLIRFVHVSLCLAMLELEIELGGMLLLLFCFVFIWNEKSIN